MAAIDISARTRVVEKNRRDDGSGNALAQRATRNSMRAEKALALFGAFATTRDAEIKSFAIPVSRRELK